MVTESTNTVYNCAHCGKPVALDKWDNWAHITRSHCTQITAVPIRLPVPPRG